MNTKKLTKKEKKNIQHQIKLAKIRKKEIEKYLKQIKKIHQEKHWSKEHYEHEQEKKIEGRTATEWINLYDKYIQYYKEILR